MDPGDRRFYFFSIFFSFKHVFVFDKSAIFLEETGVHEVAQVTCHVSLHMVEEEDERLWRRDWLLLPPMH